MTLGFLYVILKEKQTNVRKLIAIGNELCYNQGTGVKACSLICYIDNEQKMNNDLG